MARLTWFGHAGFVIEADDGGRVGIDLWRSGPKWPADLDLGRLDVLLLSHGHFDHAGDAPAIAKETGATVLCNFEVGVWLGSHDLGDQVVGMNKGGTVERDGWSFTMVEAQHSSGCPGEGGITPGGSAAGWIIRTPSGNVMYHAGDTNVFGDMALIAGLYRPHVALLPIGGHFTMGPREAAKAVELLGHPAVVPMHYGTFPLLAGTPDQLREHMGGHGAIHVLQPGQSVSLDRLEAARPSA